MNRDLAPEVVRILEQRAERLRRPPPVITDETVSWLAEITIGHQRYALHLERLRAAVPLRAVRPIPLSPSHVIGLLRFQGQLISALSFASLLGVRGWIRDPAVLLVVEYGPDRQLVALDSETTPVPRAVPAGLVEEARQRDEGNVVWTVTMPELVSVQLIDVDRLLGSWKEGIRAR